MYFIQIGILNASSLRKVEMQKDQHNFRMITIPPRLSGLRLQQSTFQSLIEPILWNNILDNDDSEEGKEVVESSSNEEDESVVSPEPPSSVAASLTPVTSATLVDKIRLQNIPIYLKHWEMKMVTLIQLTPLFANQCKDYCKKSIIC